MHLSGSACTLQHANSAAWGLVQIAIFLFAVWATGAEGGVIAGLAVAGFVMAATSSAGTLMQVIVLFTCRPWCVLPCTELIAFCTLLVHALQDELNWRLCSLCAFGAMRAAAGVIPNLPMSAAGFQDWAYHHEQPQVDVHRPGSRGSHG